MVSEIVADWRCPDIYIGCSGNFTIERVLAPAKRWRLHGNDVTIYSCVLGNTSRSPLSSKPKACRPMSPLASTNSSASCSLTKSSTNANGGRCWRNYLTHMTETAW